MKVKSHGISIGMERVDSNIFLSMKAVGKLTHEDYQTFTPMIESSLEAVTHPHVKALLDITEFDGWEIRAIWDDFKIGLKHGNEFDKIAVVGNKPWEHVMTTIGRWFMSGEMKYFENTDEALGWLKDEAAAA
jgi:hypothetical protein